MSSDCDHVMRGLGIGITQNNDLCIVMECFEYALNEKLDEAFKEKGYFEEWKIWYYFE